MVNAGKHFHDALRAFAASIAEKFKAMGTVRGQAEAQLAAPVETLLKGAQALTEHKIAVTNESESAEARGRPDMAVSSGALLVGYVELKAPGKGARPKDFTDPHDRAQWQKFRALPNLIYTDGTEWGLYQEGNETPVAFVHLGAEVTIKGAKAITQERADALADLLRRFLAWEPITPKSPKELAVALAKLCHYLRQDVRQAVRDPKSNLSEVMREWRARLFPDADDDRFADAYAQTVAYAVLLARSRGLETPDLVQATALLEPAHGLLGQALSVLTQPAALAEVRPAVDVLLRYVLHVDHAVFAKTPGEPWLYFYEDFLAEYDPDLRRDYGVYYTPVQVVQAQTALVSELLRSAPFGRELGFADDEVTVLDQGVGTGTYLLGVIERGAESARQYGGPGFVPARATVMAANIHGFEWLVGPYAVAHLRVAEELLRHGATLPQDGLHIYLTDTLESPNATPQTLPGLFGKKLSDEHRRALTVKAKQPILVCIGNPPYDRHAAADAQERGGWVRYSDGQHPDQAPLHAFIEPVRKAGRGGDLKNLYNSYVYFWRWALWKVFEQGKGPGIVSFITASSYLRGPAFLGMREWMRRTFDELWIIDLGGDNLGPRKTENVFAIQTPVAIAIGARYGAPRPDTPATVHYTSLVEGTRQEKLARLAAIGGFNDLPWSPAMTDWHAPMLPQRAGDYWSWPLLTDLFPWQHSGVEMKRTWVIAPDRDTLARRWKALLEVEGTRREELFVKSRDRTVTSVVKDVAGNTLPRIDTLRPGTPCPQLEPYGFRTLDRQWVLADNRLGDYLRPVLWAVRGPRQVYLTSLLSTVLGTGPAATVSAHVPDRHHYRGSFGGKDVIPLWRDAGGTRPNITTGLLEVLSAALGMPVTPEDLFAYCYAVLSAPGYAERFSEDLSVPGPRLPITRNQAIFVRGVELGRRLINLHTFGERSAGPGVPQGQARIEQGIKAQPPPSSYEYDASRATLYIVTVEEVNGKRVETRGVIRPVPKAVWEFSVSGYAVLQRWLDFRMADGAGRRSSELDAIRPASWPPEWNTELLNVLWVLEATVALWPQLNKLLEQVVAGPCFGAADLPSPTDEERQAPKVTTTAPEQGTLLPE